MAAGAIVLAFTTVSIDEAVADSWLRDRGWAYTGGAEGASSVLGAISGSMITLAGVVFSLTLVALSLASSQFGPRLLRNFMRDSVNQIVLGTFVATFLYCLLVLRTIRRPEEIAFVPHLSVTVGVLFALCSLGVLIYFIHHVSVSIQADQIIARVGEELIQEIDRLFPQQIGEGAASKADSALPTSFERDARPIGASRDGYVQVIDAEALMSLASEKDLVVAVERQPGQFVFLGNPVVRIWPGDRIDETLVASVNAAFVFGSQRTPVQDVEFAVNQLVEIALRALSPGVNDPFTAIACVDRLGSALCRLTQREMPSPHRLDKTGRLRVVAPPVTFVGILGAAFNQIRQNSRGSTSLLIRLLETIAAIAPTASRLQDQRALLQQAEMIARSARESIPEEEDRKVVEEYFQTVRSVMHIA